MAGGLNRCAWRRGVARWAEPLRLAATGGRCAEPLRLAPCTATQEHGQPGTRLHLCKAQQGQGSSCCCEGMREISVPCMPVPTASGPGPPRPAPAAATHPFPLQLTCRCRAFCVLQVDLALPELLSRIDFVTMDSNSGAVDNNGCVLCGRAHEGGPGASVTRSSCSMAELPLTLSVGGPRALRCQWKASSLCGQAYYPGYLRCRARDFQLNLSGAVTQQELQMKRLQLLEAYERQRLAVRHPFWMVVVPVVVGAPAAAARGVQAAAPGGDCWGI